MVTPSFAAIEEGARVLYLALETAHGIPIEDVQSEWDAMDERDRLPWRSIALKVWNAFAATDGTEPVAR